MLTVYSNQGSGNCYKVRLLLTQTGRAFRTVEMDVLTGAQREPDYLAKNPIGKIPVVEMDDGTYLAESGALLYYFSQETPLWPTDRRDQADVLSWMFFEQYSHEPNIAVARFWCYFLKAEEEYRDKLVEKREKGYQALDVMEQHLQKHSFFVAERYTIADIALFAYTHVADEGGFDLEPYPAIRTWIDRIESQPKHIPITEVCRP